MTERVAELLEQVRGLSAEEREEFEGVILEKLEKSREAASVSTWTPELERRAREALRGENLVEADVVFAELRRELSARR
jgi:hypothetical protein